MSTSRSSRSVAASIHPTRQQLDELDALLQRMLELPVNQVEETPAADAPVVESRSTRTPRLARSATPVLPPAPTPLRGPSVAPETALPRPRVQPPPQPVPAPEEIAPAPTGLEPRVVPAPEESEPMPPASLPVQPPHLFRKRPQPSTEESQGADPDQPEDTAESEEQGEDWVPLRSSWKPSPHTWAPLAESWHQAQHSSSDRPLVRRDEPVTPQPAPPAEAKVATNQLPPVTPAAIPVATARPAAPADPGPPPAVNERRPETILYPRPMFPFSETTAISPNRIIEPKVSVPVESAPSEEANSGTPWLLRPLVWINCLFNAVIALAGPPGRWLAGPAGRTMLGVVGILCLVGAVSLLVADWLGWTW